jgi:hypothetical protein
VEDSGKKKTGRRGETEIRAGVRRCEKDEGEERKKARNMKRRK